MGFGKLNIKAKAKNGRGCLDAQLIEDALCDSWELLQDGLEEQEDGVEDQIKDHFNSFNAAGNLGDILYGDSDDFKQAVGTLSAADKMAFFNELFEQGIVDKQSIEDSIQEK